MKKIIVIVLYCFKTYSQAPNILWDKTVGGNGSDYVENICRTNDGGFIIAGNSNSENSGDKSDNSRGVYDYWIVKFDNQGNKIWDRTFGGQGEDYNPNIVQTNDGGFLICGQSNSGISGDKTEVSRGGYDFWLLKIDGFGNKLWDKTIGGNGSENMGNIIATSSGEFIISGHSYSSISAEKSENQIGAGDYWIIKINYLGEKVWDKTIGGNFQDVFPEIISTDDGGFLLSGSSDSGITGSKSALNKGGFDYWVLKLNGSGEKVWDKTFGGNNDDFSVSTAKSNDGGYIITGYSKSGFSQDKTEPSRDLFGYNDYWIVKINEFGEKVWDKTIGGWSEDEVSSVVTTNDGGFIIAGQSKSSNHEDKTEVNFGDFDFWLVKINHLGQKVWDKTLGGGGTDRSPKLLLTSDGGILVSGISNSGISGNKTASNKGDYAFWILKIGGCNQPITPSVVNNSRCSAGSLTMTAIGCNGVYNWYNSKDSEVAISNLNSYTTPNLSNSTEYFISCTEGNCPSEKALVNAYINTPPAPPLLTSNSNIISPFEACTISASNCLGNITWDHDLGTGPVKIIYPINSTTYKANCITNNCISTDSYLSIIVNNNPCTDNLIQTDNIESGFYSASLSIASSANISDNTFYNAGHSIELGPGFSAGPSEIFEAKIHGCTKSISSQGILAFYNFDNNLEDNSGNGNSAYFTNGIFDNDRKGNVFSKSANFGVHGESIPRFITIPPSESLSFSNSFTICFWVKLSSLNFAQEFNLISKNDGSAFDPNSLNDKQFNVYCISNGGLYNIFNSDFFGSSGFSSTEWNHFLVKYDGSLASFYVNGVSLAHSKGNINFDLHKMNSSNIIIGGPNNFRGLIDDLKIYNTDLNDEEILTLYNIEK